MAPIALFALLAAAAGSARAADTTTWSIWSDSTCSSSKTASQSITDSTCYSSSLFCTTVGLNATVCDSETVSLGVTSFRVVQISGLASLTASNCTDCSAASGCSTKTLPFPCGTCLSTVLVGGEAYVKVDCSTVASTTATAASSATPAAGTKNSERTLTPNSEMMMIMAISLAGALVFCQIAATTLTDSSCYSGSAYCSTVGLDSSGCSQQLASLEVTSFNVVQISSMAALTMYNCTDCSTAGTCAGKTVPLPCGTCLPASLMGGTAYVKVACSSSTAALSSSSSSSSSQVAKSGHIRLAPNPDVIVVLAFSLAATIAFW
nr:hypothetical protein HK105_003696 [Polyrhizophydium stewartii]